MPTSSTWLRSLLASVLCMSVLSACTNPPPIRPHTVSEHHVWNGRMGLQIHDPAAQDSAFSGSFQLAGDEQQGTLDIYSPLGSQVAKLQWQAGSAQLQQGQQVSYSHSLQALLTQSLGTELPVEALFMWLQGQPATAAGWQVDLSRHADGRITAQRSTPLPQATLRIILQTP